MGYKEIDMKKFNENIELYYEWKTLSGKIQNNDGRKLNFPESISENLCCFVNDYKRSTGKGSEDAIAKDGRLVQIKATGNFKKDLSSFGPKSKFDELHFVRVDIERDKIEMYEIPVKNLEDIKVNKDKKFTDFQSEDNTF